jgi:hypothetical protein
MQISINIGRCSYLEKLTVLARLYFELGLRLHDALRAAEADVRQPDANQKLAF